MNKKLENKEVELLDAVKKQLEHPDTFDIPSEDDIQRIKVGYFVKLLFIPLDGVTGTERMWVKVAEIDEGKFKGTLDSVPFGINSLNLGDTIEFDSSNIIDIYFNNELTELYR